MILNQSAAEFSRLRILILASPKTGNAWLRALLSYCYDLPLAPLPLQWTPGCMDRLPERFVGHQHLSPTPELYRWLVDGGVTVLSTIRHPGDTFLSYFHYLKWQDPELHPNAVPLKADGDRPGEGSLQFVRHAFTLVYALSPWWQRLGARIVRYEDLLADPIACLRALTAGILPVEERRIEAAVMLCRPKLMVRSGLVDDRHVRTGRSGGWRDELPDEIVEAMRSMEPYASACRELGYDWDRSKAAAARFDYEPLDPFGGRRHFDNGEPIGWALQRFYLYDLPDARERWPDPVRATGESYWNWLGSPSAQAALNPAFPPATLSNVMMLAWRMRLDLQQANPDPAGTGRLDFVTWFLGQASHELEIPWGLIAPVVEGYNSYLQGLPAAG